MMIIAAPRKSIKAISVNHKQRRCDDKDLDLSTTTLYGMKTPVSTVAGVNPEIKEREPHYPNGK